MRTWITAAVAALATVGGATLVVGGQAAGGDTGLGNAIAVTPPPGWQPMSAAMLTVLASDLRYEAAQAAHETTNDVTVAVKGWDQPNSSNQLTVALTDPPSSVSTGELRSLVNSTCAGGPDSLHPLSGVPNSLEALCGGGDPGSVPDFTAIGWVQGSTLAIVRGSGLSTGMMDSVARREAALIPTTGVSGSFGFSNRDLYLIAAGVIIVLLLLVLVLRVRRRRHASALAASGAHARRMFPTTTDSWVDANLTTESMNPLPAFKPGELILPSVTPPGWHPIQGDPMKLAYWDGSQWAAYRQWDGQQWVDAAPARP